VSDQNKSVRLRRQRNRNLAVLWTLLGLVALFFAITIVQVARR
jgi:hypothetical protein